MPKLYVAPGTYSIGAHVALKALGIAHEIVKVTLYRPDTAVRQVNPLGRVPTLELDDGTVITENGAILPYLASLNPAANLGAPQGSLELARIQEWIGFLNSDVQAAFRTYGRPQVFHDDEKVQAEIKRKGLERLNLILDTLEGWLPENGWVVGNRFTIADAYLGAFARQVVKVGLTWYRWPKLQAFYQSYEAHPAVQAADAAEAAD